MGETCSGKLCLAGLRQCGERPRRARRKPGPDAVVFQRVRCPMCELAMSSVYRSNELPIRYARCQACGASFKRIEVNHKPADGEP